jgi:hypothetical protein
MGELGMALEQMFYLSQTIAAFAIVASVLFVGLEVRHSNRESRHRAIEEMRADYREERFQMFLNADSAGVWLRGLHEFATLSPVDKMRFLLVAHGFFNTHEGFFLYYRDGRMTHDMYQPQETNLDDFLAYPGMQAAWDLRKNYFHNVFRALVDDKIAAAQKRGIVPAHYHEEHGQVR